MDNQRLMTLFVAMPCFEMSFVLQKGKLESLTLKEQIIRMPQLSIMSQPPSEEVKMQIICKQP